MLTLILAALAAREIVRVSLVAHDFGIIVAQELIRRSQAGETRFAFASITRLTLGWSSAKKTNSRPDAARDAGFRKAAARWVKPESLKQGLAKVFGTRSPLTDEAFDAMWTGASYDGGHRLLHYNAERKRRHRAWEEALAAVDAPFALVWGLADPVSGAHVLAAAR